MLNCYRGKIKMDNQFFILEKLQKLTGIPLHYYGSGGDILFFSSGFSESDDPFHADASLKGVFLQASGEKPAIYLEQESIAYAHFSDKTGNVLIAGPVLCKEDVNATHRYAKAHRLPSPPPLAERTVDDLATYIALICKVLTDIYIEERDILSSDAAPQTNEEKGPYSWNMQRQMMGQADFERLPVEEELTTFRHVARGDVEHIKKHFNRIMLVKHIPVLASDEFKHHEYMICSAITLATRAAIAGGVEPNIAYATSDMYLNLLEKCESIGKMLLLHKDMMINFATLVKQNREKNDRVILIEKCKVYIEQNLHTHLSLDKVANVLYVSKWHLSREFTKSENMSLTSYIAHRRVEVAKNSLRFSDTPISEIATYLCFSSQSHFTKVFREITGCTPLEFRKYQKQNTTYI